MSSDRAARSSSSLAATLASRRASDRDHARRTGADRSIENRTLMPDASSFMPRKAPLRVAPPGGSPRPHLRAARVRTPSHRLHEFDVKSRSLPFDVDDAPCEIAPGFPEGDLGGRSGPASSRRRGVRRECVTAGDEIPRLGCMREGRGSQPFAEERRP